MKLVAMIFAALALSACAGETGPHAPAVPDPPVPTPGPTASTFLWGMVVERSGVCIAGAVVRVVRGQGAGQSIAQSTPCDTWAYDGGFFFEHLTPGAEMTIRASAPGHVDVERTLIPSLGPQTAFMFVLSPQAATGND